VTADALSLQHWTVMSSSRHFVVVIEQPHFNYTFPPSLRYLNNKIFEYAFGGIRILFVKDHKEHHIYDKET
jgi:hypothetical protein